MEHEDKPLVTDAGEESQSQESTEPEIDDLFEAGDEDVESDATDTSLTLAELNEKAGRKGDNAFKSKEDFFKHYANLNSFVGKKQEPEKKEVAKEVKPKGDYMSRAEVEALMAEKDFVSENPAAKEHMELIRDVAKSRGVSFIEAYNTVKDVVEPASAYKKEREVGVNSKNRINPMQSQRLTKLIQNVRSGDQRSEQALVEEWFKGKD